MKTRRWAPLTAKDGTRNGALRVAYFLRSPPCHTIQHLRPCRHDVRVDQLRHGWAVGKQSFEPARTHRLLPGGREAQDAHAWSHDQRAAVAALLDDTALCGIRLTHSHGLLANRCTGVHWHTGRRCTLLGRAGFSTWTTCAAVPGASLPRAATAPRAPRPVRDRQGTVGLSVRAHRLTPSRCVPGQERSLRNAMSARKKGSTLPGKHGRRLGGFAP